MRHTIVITRNHGTVAWRVSHGPEAAHREKRAFVRSLRRAKAHHEIAEVMLLNPIRTVKLDRSRAPRSDAPNSADAQAAKEAEQPQSKPKAASAKSKPKAVTASKLSSLFGSRVGAK